MAGKVVTEERKLAIDTILAKQKGMVDSFPVGRGDYT